MCSSHVVCFAGLCLLVADVKCSGELGGGIEPVDGYPVHGFLGRSCGGSYSVDCEPLDTGCQVDRCVFVFGN